MADTSQSRGSKADEAAILAANDAFYAAFRGGDLEAMDALWARSHDVAVFHPGWPGLSGRDEVMESWYRIMFVGEPPAVYPIEPTVIMNGTCAVVFCTEDLGHARTIASNTFVREDGAWRISHHQATGLPE